MSTELKLDYNDIKFENDGRLKLLIIVGTRPEIIRLAAVITKCRKYCAYGTKLRLYLKRDIFS